MNITFYSINKKQNSTKRPADSGVTYDCKLKEECSILTPNIKLDLGLSTAPSFNYAYISDWGRYYFIKNWTFYNRLWEADLEVDVLGTYKTEIGNSNLYVLRSASSFDGKILDKAYPLIYSQTTHTILCDDNISLVGTGIGSSSTTAEDIWGNKSYHNGYVIVGTFSGVNDESVSYYYMNTSSFGNMATSLFNTIPSDFGDIADGVVKAIYNPIQYIVSCKWIPNIIPGVLPTSRSTIPCGYVDIAVGSCSNALNMTQNNIIYGIYIDIPVHPDTNTKGLYMNASPYTELILSFPPFCVTSLDVNKLAGYSSILCKVVLDIRTGQADLFVQPFNKSANTSGAIIYHTNCLWLVDLPLTQTTVDYIGALTQTVSPITHALGEGLKAGSLTSGVASVPSSISGINEALSPTPTTQGNMGVSTNFTSNARPRLCGIFFKTTNEDNDHYGKPLCKEVVINTLSGYVQCRDGDISLSATQEERETVSDYLVNGFFYE